MAHHAICNCQLTLHTYVRIWGFDSVALICCNVPHPLVSVVKPSKDPWHLLLEELLIHHLPSSPQGSLNALELLTELLPLPLPMEVPQVSHHHWLHYQVIAQCLSPPDIAVRWSALFGPPVMMFMPSLGSAY